MLRYQQFCCCQRSSDKFDDVFPNVPFINPSINQDDDEVKLQGASWTVAAHPQAGKAHPMETSTINNQHGSTWINMVDFPLPSWMSWEVVMGTSGTSA